jgi:hypothetical protein
MGQKEIVPVAAPMQQSKKMKKPGTAGLFDEYLFYSVHFASLAI